MNTEPTPAVSQPNPEPKLRYGLAILSLIWTGLRAIPVGVYSFYSQAAAGIIGILFFIAAVFTGLVVFTQPHAPSGGQLWVFGIPCAVTAILWAPYIVFGLGKLGYIIGYTVRTAIINEAKRLAKGTK